MIKRIYNCLYKRIFIFIFIFCIVIVFFSLTNVHSKKIVFSKINPTENINKKVIIDNCEKYNMSIYYPNTKNSKVNNNIKFIINNYKRRIKYDTKHFIPTDDKDKVIMNIDYNITSVNKEIISIIFLVDYRYGQITNKEIITKTYNLSTGEELYLNDMFDEKLGYSDLLSIKAREALINNKKIDNRNLIYFIDDINFSNIKSFDGYTFSNSHLSIYFNSNKLSSKFIDIYEIQIPWIEVEHLLKNNILLIK
ncbi:hypothetical protein [Sedimentibacter sp. MB31-C6]|uniref:hypothetical protein n=1 Tax=Sedimentibacter sp. MB31-C6 TaxID=3109366 RepID=UPI002DDD938C|nr:hypothetical protein [Sedimentibacter sp. MB36-C1]WSI04378.1 hypothetical protein U8307_00955 [Sedimentibacter sp. MB36-C1]